MRFIRFVFIFVVTIIAIVSSRPAAASDACSATAIEAGANVAVSDGSSFKVKTFFHTKDQLAIQHIREQVTTTALEGPAAWVQSGDQSSLGSDFHKAFALGHQYHALLLHFDDIIGETNLVSNIAFQGGTYTAKKGAFPYGGEIFLILGKAQNQPVGLRLAFPETPPIDASFSDWATIDTHTLPRHITIDDGSRSFDYAYTHISIKSKSPLWFYDALPAPEIDAVNIHRLHRKLMAAHCLGDAKMMADLSTDQVIIASRGHINTVTKIDMLNRFTGVFKRVNYTQYHDLKQPIIEVAQSGDIGWVAVNPRAIGKTVATEEPFDDQWAWVMLARKTDGQWLNAGNASNYAE